MTLRNRVIRIEQRHPASTIKRVVLIPVYSGETKEQAVDRWKLEHTDRPPPDEVIFLVPLEAKP